MRRISLLVGLVTLALWAIWASALFLRPAHLAAETEPKTLIETPAAVTLSRESASDPRPPSGSPQTNDPPSPVAGSAAANQPVTVVVWISVDGLRGDYLDSIETPFFDRIMQEGAFSRQLVPVFPSLTFPSHVSQCTGALVELHGIAANALYDFEHDRRWSYPSESRTILCEPIWTTAKRQRRRTAVFDWPVSHKQTGPHAADYFNQAFEPNLSDQQRLERLWDAWARDRQPQPLQLLMGYFSGVDSAGHKYGPHAPEIKHAVQEADHLLADALNHVQQLLRKKHGDNARLYFIISTDHGMEDIHTLVSLRSMLADAYTDSLRSVTSGSVANIYLDFITDPTVKQAQLEYILEKLDRYPFAHAYTRDSLPPEWGYNCPGRTGDVVVSLDPGNFFSEQPGPPTRPVDPREGPLGMHGYPFAQSPSMAGFLGIWRSGEPIGGINLGKVDSRRLHATVAQLLDIDPASTALNEPLPRLLPGS